ncbi:hypothetical protein T459_04431 [Capsicum annuum]|uniref:Uncharacterized protein n=1 Tax=Capsicum annuum TaxID=4072 RepID=A0A2G3A529_CAPAN|nr:hypothetical protein T459_04431 [Capsicum annuum]
MYEGSGRGDGENREKMAIEPADEPSKCPEPAITLDKFMARFCAYNFTSGPAAGNFCWDQQPKYTAYRENSFGHGILKGSIEKALLSHFKVVVWTAYNYPPQTPLDGNILGAYSDSRGIPGVSKEVADFIERRDGYPSDPENIFLTDGGSKGMMQILQTIIRGHTDGGTI